MRNSFFGSVEI